MPVKVERIRKNCKFCGKDYSVLPSKEKKSSFCSISCGTKYRNFTDNPMNKIEVRKKAAQTKKGMVPWNKGKPHTVEAREKIRRSLRERSPREKIAWKEKLRQQHLGKKMPESLKEMLRKLNTGRKQTEEAKNKIKLAKIGTHLSKETLEKISGKNCHFWKGGITPLQIAYRTKYKYLNWRKAVFERDNYTCQKCQKRGGYLEAHHVKPFSQFEDLRMELTNGETLCKNCHKNIHFGGV